MFKMSAFSYRLVDPIKAGQYQNIVVLTGAGISTSSGIPDYRSSTGLFKQMQERYGLAVPEDIFTPVFRDILKIDPIYQEHLAKIDQVEPTPAHRWCAWLAEQGWLRRVYTQNIDGLHQKAGLDPELMVEFHGSIAQQNVTLYGETIANKVVAQVMDDFVLNPIPVDLLIVIGTSLQVAPFCALPNLVETKCPRALIDLCPSNAFKNPFSKRKATFENMYDCSAPAPRSYCTFKKDRVKRQVSLRPAWTRKSRWTNHILEMSADEWARLF